MEGFAVYGASQHPTAAFPVETMRMSAKVCQQRLAGNQQPAAHEHGGSQPVENSDAVELERAAWADARPFRHWSWSGSLAEMIVTLWTHWRREQEIRRAVAAPAEYDDRTLRDLGICGRSAVERVVRYCRDC